MTGEQVLSGRVALVTGASSGLGERFARVLDAAGASVVIPMQHYLRAGEKEIPGLHVFNCAPGPKIFAISLQADPGPAVFTAYGKQALRVVVKPDFGWINVLIAPFVPKLHAWFDPAKEWAFVGDEAARYYQGTKIMLVKTQPISLAPQLRSTR